VKYAFIKQQSQQYSITQLVNALDVSSSGYYAWIKRGVSLREKANQLLTKKIEILHKASRYIYGSPRIHQDLRAQGERVSRKRIERLMRENSIQSKMAKRFVITTDSRNTLAPAPDRLQRQFMVSDANKAWVSDTTFIKTRQGWLYLAVVLDLFSRQVIGWAMGDKNDSELVQAALTMAIWRRGQVKDVIVHSDRGSTYASSTYQQQLTDYQLICSMSRKGECLDNAVAESFFGTLKTELVDHEDYKTKAEARQSIFEYIEVFYNRQRRHSYLGYLNPVEFERQYASH
jgi:transposase InsO family protein